MSDADGRTDRVYFRQLLSGRDFARGDMMARQMVNFVYLIGDRETGEAVVVDPAYAVQDLLDIVEADGMRLTGVLGHALPPRPPRRRDGRVVARGHRRAAREGPGAGARADATSCPGSSAPPASAPRDLVGHDSGDVVQVGRRVQSSSSTRPATRRAASASSSTAGWWPATRSSSRAAGAPTSRARTRSPCTSRSTPGWPGCPTTPSSSPATSTRPTPRRAWATPGSGTTCSGPALPRSGWPCSACERVEVTAGGLGRDSTVLVVGASLAGWRAVEALRAEGFEGTISLVGEERHLPYDRPPLSKQVLAGNVAAREGGAGRQAALERAARARGAGAAGRGPRRRRRAGSSSTTAACSTATPSSSPPGPPRVGCRVPRPSARPTACSRCARSTTPWRCAPRSPRPRRPGSS